MIVFALTFAKNLVVLLALSDVKTGKRFNDLINDNFLIRTLFSSNTNQFICISYLCTEEEEAISLPRSVDISRFVKQHIANGSIILKPNNAKSYF